MAVNKCIFIGNLGRDPEVRHMPNGDAVARISIACTDRWKDRASGEQKEATEWVNVSFFGKLAEIAGQHLKKGTQVYIEGKLRTRKYTDREGVERYATEIIADQMQMLGSRQDGKPASATGQENAYAAAKGGARPYPPELYEKGEDDIPF